ncbi:MAG: SDR family oxidoreductase [Acidimicrobiia bacterium]|nr:SDR family oxidoreductase [Acidimicrobiia bacterium]MDX2467608.1 SDR family oxidoreductase [Acidimicrobiia bacterium]
MKVLVTGATGYIGGRLVPRLLDGGHEVRCMTRDPDRLTLDPWRDQVEVVAADAFEPASLDTALDGCDAAFFLIHAMKGSPKSYAEQGRLAAANFRDAADRVGLGRIVYLGGLGSQDDQLSEHLASRQEVGEVLAMGDTPVIELRAAVIIGSGSMSFEMIRHLTEVLPVMMTPRWIETKCQPIAVRNVLDILVSLLDDPNPSDMVYDIGGPDILTYEEMMRIYAEVAGLRKRLVLPFPIFSSRLSAPFVGLVTPLPVEVARPLIESVLNDVVVRRPSPPGFDPGDLIPYPEALQRALYSIDHSEVETRWSDALASPGAPLPRDPAWSGALMQTDRRVADSKAPTQDLFWAVTRIGGDVGYYAMNWAWTIRGWIDQVIGGVGLRRGRRDPEDLRPGESLDFFRVAEIDPAQGRLLLQAEMKVPGTAWLEWSTEWIEGGSRLVQTAWFVPRGLMGRLYWWILLPFHAPIWRLMVRRMARTAERRAKIS